VLNREATTYDHVEDPAMSRPAITGAGQSMLFTMVGATGLILSGFLEWIRPDGVRGIEIGYRSLYQTEFTTNAPFFRSAGAVAVAIGLLAVLGLASRAGWVTRLAGALGIIAFALFTITLYRMNLDVPTSLGAGPWFILGGGIVAMFGGFFATRPQRVIVTNS
jgi:hypothetical protein